MGNKKPLVSIIVLNLNGLRDTKKCIKSIFNNTKYGNFEILILDNGSKKNEAIKLSSAFGKRIKTYRSDTNLGYTGGNNLLLKKTNGKYVLLLNNDTSVENNWLSPLVNLLENDRKIAVVQPKILQMSRKRYFDYAGAAGGYIDKYGYPFTRGRVFDTLEKDVGQYDNVCEIFWASGAACIIRKSIVGRIGGLFSENLFNYMEEIDFCWRVWNRGYKVVFTPSSVVYHKGAATSRKNLTKKRFWEHRNNLLIISRNLDRKSLLKIMLPRFLLEIATYFGYLAKREYRNILALFLAHLNYSTKFIMTRYKRNRLPNQENLPIYPGSIAYEYFVKRVRKFSDLNWDSKQSISFLIFNTKVSGGIKVIAKHAAALKKSGHAVNIYKIYGGQNNVFEQIKIKPKSIVNVLFNRKTDVLVATYWPTSYLAYILPAKQKYYLIQDWEVDFHKNQALRLLARLSYLLPIKMLVVSDYLKQKIKRYNTKTEVKIVPNAVIDTSVFKPKRQRSQTAGDKKVIKVLSVVSWYQHHKGPDILSQAVVELKKIHLNYHFTLVSKEKKAYAPVFDKFISNPKQETIANLYRNSDILLSTSRTEGFFLPGLEAMTCGCLFVTTDSGGVREYANKSNSIVLERVQNLWEKDVINRVVRNPAKYDKLVARGYQKAQEYSEKNLESKLNKLYFQQ